MPPAMPAIVSSGEDGVLKETSWPELRRKVGRAGDASEGARRPLRRSRRGLSAQHPRDHHRLPRHRQHRRGLERVRARHGGARGDRPLQADRAEGADRLRRRHLCRTAARPASGGRGVAAVAAERRSTVIIHGDGGEPAATADARLADYPVGDRRRDRRLRTGMAAVRSSALDRLFQRHHRPAEADRARPWRRHHRGAAAERAAQRHRLQLRSRTRSASAITGISSTGWIMWNCQVAGLLNGTTCCIFDGSPGGSKEKPDWATLWRFVAKTEGDVLRRRRGVLRQLHQGRYRSRRLPATCRSCARSARPDRRSAATPSNGSTTASRALPRSTAAPHRPTCGGPTCPAAPTSPAPSSAPTANCRRRRALMQCRLLGAAVEAFNEQGRAVIDEVGELVCTEPMPSMPLQFWNDDGDAALSRAAISKPIRTISTAPAAARSGVMATGSRSMPTAPA